MTAQDKSGRLNRLYAIASGINEAIVRIPEESRLFEEACRIAVEKGGLVMAWVGLAQQASDVLSVAARWGKDDGYLDAIIDNEPQCVATISGAGTLLEVNPAGLRTLQAPSLDAVIGQPAADFVHPQDRDAYRRLHANAMAGNGGKAQLRLVGLLGDVRWLDIQLVPLRSDDGNISSVLSVSSDVTLERASLEKLEQSAAEIRHLAERLGTTLDSITDAIVTVDRDWVITFVNREAERVLQRPREVALAEQRTVAFEAYFEPLNAWLELRVYPSPQGGLTIYFRDVTERRRSRLEIVELNTQLEQRVRERTAQLEIANHELGAFSYSVAHDLRAPLAAIGGFSQALEQELAAGPGTSDRCRHYLERMRAGLRQTHEMIDAMLALSQLSRTELRWEEVDLAVMARTAFDNLRAQDPRDAALHVQHALPARGDPRLLQLVLDNLVGNAWKFTGHRQHAEITVGSEAGNDGDTVFFIRDNGVGFDMEYASKLFGAFQRLHSQTEFPGTGVGLAWPTSGGS